MVKKKIVCFGSIGWDYIGKTKNASFSTGDDLPGEIEIKIGGVATNIAIALSEEKKLRSNYEIILLGGVGSDYLSTSLLRELKTKGINCDFISINDGYADSYVCIEKNGDLFGAIASSKQLEKVENKIFQQFVSSLEKRNEVFTIDYLVLDTNLSSDVLLNVTDNKTENLKNIIISCASTHKATNLRELLVKRNCSIYLNLLEASAIANRKFSSSSEAANYLYNIGAKEAVVTDGSNEISSKSNFGLSTLIPLSVEKSNTTGAGDCFLAAHLLSKINDKGSSPLTHLKKAENAARKKIENVNEKN